MALARSCVNEPLGRPDGWRRGPTAPRWFAVFPAALRARFTMQVLVDVVFDGDHTVRVTRTARLLDLSAPGHRDCHDRQYHEVATASDA